MAKAETKSSAKAKAPKATKEGKVTKAKKVKDPNAPKRPTGAYFFFCNEKRGDVQKANPAFKIGDIGKELGAQWKKLTDAEKKKYNKLAEQDKERYQKEMKDYQEEPTSE